MFDYFARLIATAAGFVALTLGLSFAPTIPAPRMPTAHTTDARSTLDSLDIAEGLQATLVAQAPTTHQPDEHRRRRARARVAPRGLQL